MKIKRAFRRYILAGDFEGDMNEAYKWFGYITWAIIIFAAVVFAPAVISIFWGKP